MMLYKRTLNIQKRSFRPAHVFLSFQISMYLQRWPCTNPYLEFLITIRSDNLIQLSFPRCSSSTNGSNLSDPIYWYHLHRRDEMVTIGNWFTNKHIFIRGQSGLEGVVGYVDATSVQNMLFVWNFHRKSYIRSNFGMNYFWNKSKCCVYLYLPL